jgi:hypothetical protein
MLSVVASGEAGLVSAGNQTPEWWADVIMRDLIGIEPTAPEPLRRQCEAFRDRMRAVLVRRLRSALESERKTLLREIR